VKQTSREAAPTRKDRSGRFEAVDGYPIDWAGIHELGPGSRNPPRTGPAPTREIQVDALDFIGERATYRVERQATGRTR